MKPRTKSIIEIFDEGTPIDRAAKRAVREELAKNSTRDRRSKAAAKPPSAKRSRKRKVA